VFPWLYLWAPMYRFPYSGAVIQNIQPQTDWFFANVRPGAGVADIEREVVLNKASYGRQLGQLMDSVLALAERLPPAAGEAEPPALQELRRLQAEIQVVKERVRVDQSEQARELLQRLSQSDPQALAALLAEFRRD